MKFFKINNQKDIFSEEAVSSIKSLRTLQREISQTYNINFPQNHIAKMIQHKNFKDVDFYKQEYDISKIKEKTFVVYTNLDKSSSITLWHKGKTIAETEEELNKK